MNFKLYVESDTRRDFLKKLVGGAAAVAKGDVGKVINNASQLISNVLFFDIDKLATDVRDYIYENGEHIADEMTLEIDNAVMFAAKNPINQILTSTTYKNAVDNIINDMIELRANTVFNRIKRGDLNVSEVHDMFNMQNNYHKDFYKTYLTNVADKSIDPQNAVVKFISNGKQINVLNDSNIKSYMPLNKLIEITNKTSESAYYTDDMHTLFDKHRDDIVDNLMKTITNAKLNAKKTRNNTKIAINLHKKYALNVYNKLNQLL